MTLPSWEMSTPEPISPKRTTPPVDTSLPRARITTTLGLALRYRSPRVCGRAAAGATTSSTRVRRGTASARMPLLLTSLHPAHEQHGDHRADRPEGTESGAEPPRLEGREVDGQRHPDEERDAHESQQDTPHPRQGS